VFKTVSEQLEKEVSGGESADSAKDLSNLEFLRGAAGGEFKELATSQLYHITILLDLQINPLIRSRLLSTPSIQALAGMLDLVDAKSFPGSECFITALLMICETMACNYKVLQILVQPTMSLLLPVLFHKLQHSSSPDVKFLSFKIYTDILS